MRHHRLRPGVRAEPKPLSPAQARRVEEQWSTFTRTGHLEVSMSTGRSVLLLIGAVVFAGLAALAIVVNVQAVMWGEETWHILLNPMFWIFVAGFVLFGVLGIPAATVAIANRPSLVLTREGYFRVVGLPGRCLRHGFLPCTAVEAVILTDIPSLRWPMPPTRLVTLVLTPETFDRHIAHQRATNRRLRPAESRFFGPRAVALHDGYRHGTRVAFELFACVHRQAVREF